MASSALLAHLVVSRFVDHQPWHRQSVILRRQVVEIDRDVMGRWSRKLAWLMAPLGERLLAHILEAPKIHGDETPVTLLQGEDGSHTAYFWVYLRSEEHTSELQSLMRISYAVFCLKKKKIQTTQIHKQY